jgi:hypothetical protein
MDPSRRSFSSPWEADSAASTTPASTSLPMFSSSPASDNSAARHGSRLASLAWHTTAAALPSSCHTLDTVSSASGAHQTLVGPARAARALPQPRQLRQAQALLIHSYAS